VKFILLHPASLVKLKFLDDFKRVNSTRRFSENYWPPWFISGENAAGYITLAGRFPEITQRGSVDKLHLRSTAIQGETHKKDPFYFSK